MIGEPDRNSPPPAAPRWTDHLDNHFGPPLAEAESTMHIALDADSGLSWGTPPSGGTELDQVAAQAEPADLEALLTVGPFHKALRAAIRARGLSLERIQAKLAVSGTPVSLATLSHWQSGRSQPERDASLIALARLEDILGLVPRTLAVLLEPPRPRGRRSTGDPIDLAAIYHDKSAVIEALRKFDTIWGQALIGLSSHDRVTVGPDGFLRSLWNRRVLRATADGPDHMLAVYNADGDNTPLVVPLRGCSLGRVVTDHTAGLVVAELAFGHPLRQGEYLVMEHRVDMSAPFTPDTRWERRIPHPIREYVLEVEFTSATLPVRCVQISAPSVDSEDFTERLLNVDEFGVASTVALDLGPCRLGVQWQWSATDSTD